MSILMYMLIYQLRHQNDVGTYTQDGKKNLWSVNLNYGNIMIKFIFMRKYSSIMSCFNPLSGNVANQICYH